MKPLNDGVSVDMMISLIVHELVELSTNLLVNRWYVGEDLTTPLALTEIRDLPKRLYRIDDNREYIGC